MTKRKQGIILMLVAASVLPIGLFVDSWQVRKAENKGVFSSASTEISFGLRKARAKVCQRKRCESGSVDYSYKLFKTTGAKIWYTTALVTFWGGLIMSVLLLIGGVLLWTNKYHGHTFMNLSLLASLVVMVAGALCIRPIGFQGIEGLKGSGILGNVGFSYIPFMIACTAALFGIHRVWKGTVEEEDAEWLAETEQAPLAEDSC